MEFLKELLGEELYNQVAEKINAHNGNEANKDKQIKIADLGSGEYVSKLKYDDIVQQLTGKNTELDTANGLIAELKKGTKGNEELQSKIAAYDTQVADLQKELAETKLNSALKVLLLSEKVVDVDYVTYKIKENLKEKGETLELDENENIKNAKALIDGVKTQLPSMFETSSADGKMRVFGDNRLPEGDQRKPTPTKEQFKQMSYEDRVALKQSNEQLYRELSK